MYSINDTHFISFFKTLYNIFDVAWYCIDNPITPSFPQHFNYILYSIYV